MKTTTTPSTTTSTERSASPISSRVQASPTTTTTTNTNHANKGDTAIADMIRQIPKSASTIHLVVLVHGWMGNSLEMDSLKECLEQHQMATTKDDAIDSDRQYYFIHAAKCNEKRTHDGIEAGGSRLAQEINDIIRQLQHPPSSQDDEESQDDNASKSSSSSSSSSSPPKTITLSLVGNSLGGLYARFALSEIDFQQGTIIPKLFVTTATPHLGICQNTFLKLPRAIEYPIATVMQQTGQDLFCFSSILEQMTLESKFVQPLLKFEHRIAYANVYGTDFQVPTATAAFWEESSESEHVLVEQPMNDDDDDNNNNKSKRRPKSKTKSLDFLQAAMKNSPFYNPNIVAIYETPSKPTLLQEAMDLSKRNKDKNEEQKEEEKEKDEQKQEEAKQEEPIGLSKYLDAMGWTKVLVDVRQHLPSWKKADAQSRDEEKENVLENSQRASDDETAPLKSPKDTTTITTTSAQALLDQYGQGKFLTVPLGHTVMVANAKDALNRWITQGGKPIMDSLAGSMVRYLSNSCKDDEAPQWPGGL